MNDLKTDGILQVTAAISLLEFSRLVKWDRNSAQFTHEDREIFEQSWRSNVSPVFGRLICWINFSAGAEFLAKGVCLLHEIDFLGERCVPANPTGDLNVWATQYIKDPKSSTVKIKTFGTLGNLVNLDSKTTQKSQQKNNTDLLTKLCVKVNATDEEKTLLLAAYDFLRQTIRNRDAHAYRPNERDNNFPLVPDLFVKCFNLLLSWLPDGPSQVNIWRDTAEELVAPSLNLSL